MIKIGNRKREMQKDIYGNLLEPMIPISQQAISFFKHMPNSVIACIFIFCITNSFSNYANSSNLINYCDRYNENKRTYQFI